MKSTIRPTNTITDLLLNYLKMQFTQTKNYECSCLFLQGPPGTGKTVTSATIVYQVITMSMMEP